MSTTRGIIPADYDNDDAAHFAVGYLSSAIKGFLDGHHDVDLLRSSYEKLTAALDERDRRRPVLAVPTEWRRGDPEPPQGINILRDPVAEGEAFLCRLENGAWEWFSDPDDRTGVRVSQSWDQAMQEADGPVYPVPAVSEQEEA